jgi:isocitrate/isopropylmalate dehydrogenase
VHQAQPIEVATDVSMMTRAGVERILRFAFRLAQSRPRKLLTVNPERRYPSMFEPIHGSAFDITGKGLANPIGTLWSVVMMLEHLGEARAAQIVMGAIEHVTANSSLHTRDLGGTATTAQVTQAVCARITVHPEVASAGVSR